ncbi:unnamed protein product [Penicillium salamii]|uniref:Uncharacterized protein n=1 Tax=Penicillium salamii TaxID=1612424 RepID=A0A9W4NFF2_9EURO|nr:unnamed protein product [Penicillium salamii]
MGVPYTEPAMGGIRKAEPGDIPVYGVAYLLSEKDMQQVILSEGYALHTQQKLSLRLWKVILQPFQSLP